MKEDALDRILKRCGLYNELNEKKESLAHTIGHLVNALEAYHGKISDDAEALEVLARLVWDVVRLDPSILAFLIENDKFDLKEVEEYGGILSKRITARIFKIAREEGS